MEHYYHLFANGDDARDFITSTKDFEVAFNRFAVCAARCPKVKVLAFSIEETHPHALIFGEYDECVRFKRFYETMTYSYIISSRGGKDGVILELELFEVLDIEYLRTVASYILVQPTKDGKQIMPYDYRWGTASLYFRPKGYPFIWTFDSDWNPACCCLFGELPVRSKREITHATIILPDNWLVCNNLILPSNYVDIKTFEAIFETCNRFRVFMSAGKNQQYVVVEKMSGTKGIIMNDMEARTLAQTLSENLFGKKDSRWLTPADRLRLAKELRDTYRLSFRQIATLSRLPEQEIRKYFK